MSTKLRSYTMHFLRFTAILLVFSLVTFAQSPKTQAKKPTQPKNEPPVKTLTTFNSTVAYKIWDDWYKAQEQGIQLPEPTLTIRARDDKEFNEISRTWNKAAQKAKLAAEKRREDARNGKTSFQAQSVFPLLPDSMPVAQPIPTTNPLEHFNQPTKGIAGLSSYRMGPQPAVQSQPMPNNNANNAAVMAQNNRGIAETNAKNISYNVAKAKELANIAFASTDTPGITTQYHIDNNNPTGLPQVVEELQNGQVVRQYTYGADGIISMRQLINGQWVVSFFIKDGQGSVRMLTDVNGNVTDTYDYDAYGNLINQTGNTPNTRLYNGEEFDPDLGFYYLRARFLDTVKGRFLSQDTFEGTNEDPLSLNKYTYAQVDPINNHDPSGLFAISTIASTSILNQTILSSATLQTSYFTGQGGAQAGGQPIRTLKGNLCDFSLGASFGDPGAIGAANGFDYKGEYRGHLDPNDKKFMHLYGNEEATAITNIYIPPKGILYEKLSGGDATYQFAYNTLQGERNVKLSVSHVQGFRLESQITAQERLKRKYPRLNIKIPIDDPSAAKNSFGFVYIGQIGGPGGQAEMDGKGIHSHFVIGHQFDVRDGALYGDLSFPQLFCGHIPTRLPVPDKVRGIGGRE